MDNSGCTCAECIENQIESLEKKMESIASDGQGVRIDSQEKRINYLEKQLEHLEGDFSPSSLHVCLPLYVNIVPSKLSPLCLPLVISPVLFPPLSPHLLLDPSLVCVFKPLFRINSMSVRCVWFPICILCLLPCLLFPDGMFWILICYFCSLIWTLLLGATLIFVLLASILCLAPCVIVL